jgi:hypothetical protein
MKNIQKQRTNSNFQMDGISPNIFIVEEGKHENDEQRMIRQKVKNNRQKLHQYFSTEPADQSNVSTFALLTAFSHS